MGDATMGEGRLARRIGELLRLERHKARMSQADLAAEAGTAQQCVSQVETGRYAPTTAVVERLFAALELQLRVDTEPLDADLDGAIERGREQSGDELDAILQGFELITRRAGDLGYLLDGELAARLHGVPAPVRDSYAIVVAEGDLDGLADWIFAIPNCLRYSERWRDFSNYDIDPRRPGALRWRTPYGELAVRLVAVLPQPVEVRAGDRVMRLRPLPDVERDHPLVGRLLRRAGSASGRRGA